MTSLLTDKYIWGKHNTWSSLIYSIATWWSRKAANERLFLRYAFVWCRFMVSPGECLWPTRSMWAPSEKKQPYPSEKCCSGVKSRSQQSKHNYIQCMQLSSTRKWHKIKASVSFELCILVFIFRSFLCSSKSASLPDESIFPAFKACSMYWHRPY